VLRKHARIAGIDIGSFGPHALRATAATNALDRGADLGKAQEWLSARQRVDQPPLRPAPLPPRQPHLPRGLLNGGISCPIWGRLLGLIAGPLV
jgi:hypothetical protein